MKHRLISLLTAFSIAVGISCTGAVVSLSSSAEEETQPLRIMSLGDSITDGYINGDNGYRKYLCYNLQKQGFTDFDMVGPKGSDSASYTYNGETFTYDGNHAGYSGYAIQTMTSMEYRSGILETISGNGYDMIAEYNPDIVLLQIGTNDILSAYNDGIKDRLSNLVDTILADMTDENDMLFVSTIPDIDASIRYDWLGAYQTVYNISYWTDPDGLTAKVQECIDSYNASIRELVTEKQAMGEPIRFADIHSVVDMKTGLFDGVHPNEDGYAQMGEYWSEQILAYLNEEPPTTDTTTTTTETTETTTTETQTTETEVTTETTTLSEETSDTTTWTTQSQPELLLGDVNMDDSLQIADVVFLTQYLLGNQSVTREAFERADMTQDEQVNGFDLAVLRQTILQAEEGNE